MFVAALPLAALRATIVRLRMGTSTGDPRTRRLPLPASSNTVSSRGFTGATAVRVEQEVILISIISQIMSIMRKFDRNNIKFHGNF